jgi:hypothetical protein
MNSEALYFNGINGVTGSYGQPPMTAGDLARHIEGASKRLQYRGALRGLGRENAHALAELVKLLAHSTLDPAERDETWHQNWVRSLARTLAVVLLPEEYQEPAKIDDIAHRLERHTLLKIERIADLLASPSMGDDLETLLLEDEDRVPDNGAGLRGKLVQETQIGLVRATQRVGKELTEGDLRADRRQQRAWLEEQFHELQLIPVDSMNAGSRSKIEFRRPLLEALDRWAGMLKPSIPALDALHRRLAEAPQDLGWLEMLDVVKGGVEAILPEMGSSLAWDDLTGALHQWLEAIRVPEALREVKEGVDPASLAQAGWGILFPYEDPRQPARVPAIKEALRPLLDLRRSQAGQYFRVYDGAEGYRPNDTAARFVARHGTGVSDPANPEKVPYYLLIVGSPEEIPFHFQYQLDVQYAVGRIDFGGDLAAYANYARNVVAAESGEATVARRATFFGVSNPDDRATQLSASHLVEPLGQYIEKRFGDHWQVDVSLREAATKARLLGLLRGPERPTLLFAACHGVEFPKDDPQGRQERYQGALLCQDWAGPQRGRGEVPREAYLTGEDLGSDLDLRGLVAFFFACYSAGTPRFDEYTAQAFRERCETIANHPFVAALPSAMLGLPRGALAVVGHVERAWGTSYLGERQSTQITVFESAVERLLKGFPVGAAMEYFNGRHAALSSELAAALENRYLRQPDPYELAGLWTANNDARGYIVLGDPAVRLFSPEVGSE